jgi:folylpolyglutamate synthase/dihydropteroate synthase
MAGRIASVAEQVFCLKPDNPRALSAEEYADVFRELGVPSTPCASVADAVSAASKWGREHNAPVVCLGSLYMYGEVVAALKK